MSAASPRIQELARRLVERELEGHDTPDELAMAVERLFTRFGEQVLTLIGGAGLHAVLRRASHLARSDAAWLAEVEIVVDREVTINGIRAAAAREGMDAIAPGAAALLVTTLDLLCSFIGEELTLAQLRKVCPDAQEPGPVDAPEEGRQA